MLLRVRCLPEVHAGFEREWAETGFPALVAAHAIGRPIKGAEAEGLLK
jgi:hypothetical protein